MYIIEGHCVWSALYIENVCTGLISFFPWKQYLEMHFHCTINLHFDYDVASDISWGGKETKHNRSKVHLLFFELCIFQLWFPYLRLAHNKRDYKLVFILPTFSTPNLISWYQLQINTVLFTDSAKTAYWQEVHMWNQLSLFR